MNKTMRVLKKSLYAGKILFSGIAYIGFMLFLLNEAMDGLFGVHGNKLFGAVFLFLFLGYICLSVGIVSVSLEESEKKERR